MSGLFDELVARYKVATIALPKLKAVTLAQWILESGRGTSGLATKHLNFAGLKWRSEMLGFATPVEFDAHDGLDFYCSFASLDAFIVGYWKFLSRSPYDGWEQRAADGPEAFIRFIGPIYNPAVGVYVAQIIALMAEATERLAKATAAPALPPPLPVAGAPLRIVIDPGHGGTVTVGGSSPNNATSPSGEKEKDWTLDIAKRTRTALLTRALHAGINVEVILTRETDSNKGLAARANIALSKQARLFLSIHFNGFDHQVRGVETWIHSINVNKDEDAAFAQIVQEKVLTALHAIDPGTVTDPKYDRKVKEKKLGVLNDIELGNTIAAHRCRACLVEIESMDVPAVEQLFRLHAADMALSQQAAGNRQKVADALADALLAGGGQGGQ